MNAGNILAKLMRKSGVGDLMTNMSDDLARYASEAPINKMYGTHSLNASKLAGADELGGFAMPSIAVRNSNAIDGNKLSEFGDVVMLPKGDTYLPSRSTKVYSTDAYTPMMPKVDVNSDPELWNQLSKKYPGIAGEKGSIDYNYDFMTMDRGDNALPIYELLKKTDIEPGTSEFYDFRNMLRDGRVSDDVSNFIDELNGTVGQPRFMNGYTPGGSPRYSDYTLDNAIKIMKSDIRENGGNIHGSVGGPSTMGVIEAENSLPMKSLKEMRERSKWLNADPLDTEKYADLMNVDLIDLPHTGKYREMNKGLMTKLNQVANDLHLEKTGKEWSLDSNPFTSYDRQMGVLGDMDWYSRNSPTMVSGVEEMSGPMNDFKKILANQPTKYFESKPTRGVGFDEFEGALLPDGDDVSRAILERRGVPILGSYDRNTEGALEQLVKRLIQEGKIPLYSSAGMLGGGSILGGLLGGVSGDQQIY